MPSPYKYLGSECCCHRWIEPFYHQVLTRGGKPTREANSVNDVSSQNTGLRIKFPQVLCLPLTNAQVWRVVAIAGGNSCITSPWHVERRSLTFLQLSGSSRRFNYSLEPFHQGLCSLFYASGWHVMILFALPLRSHLQCYDRRPPPCLSASYIRLIRSCCP